MNTSEFLNRKALITGGATRIGRALSLALGEVGCDVAIHYHSNEKGAVELAEKLRQMGRKSAVVNADFRNPEAPQELANQAVKTLGGLDFLINNASVYPSPERKTGVNDLLHESLDSWELSLTINARAPFFLIKHLASILQHSECGCIVNILDSSATNPFVSRAAHSVSKAALASVTKLAAKTLYPKVRVNGIELGAILPPEGLEREACEATQWGGIDAVSKAVIYLLRAEFVTGEIMKVDGGESLLKSNRT